MRRRKNGERPTGDVAEKILFARRTRQVIKLISGGLLFFFAWLQLRDVAVDSVVNSVTPDIIWRAAFIIYFLAWTAGTLFDTDIQELTLTTVPNKGSWPPHTFGVVAILAVVAFVLCWTRGDIQTFALALTTFVIVDHVSWRYLIWLLKPSIAQSRSRLQESDDLISLESLNVVVDQIQGRWKWIRLFAVGIPSILLIDAFAFIPKFQLLVARAFQTLVPSLSIQDAASLAASILVMLFVVGMEAWHWTIRARTKIALDLFDDLGRSFKLVKS